MIVHDGCVGTLRAALGFSPQSSQSSTEFLFFCQSEHSSFCHPEELLATKDLDNTAQPNKRMSTEFLFFEELLLSPLERGQGVCDNHPRKCFLISIADVF